MMVAISRRPKRPPREVRKTNEAAEEEVEAVSEGRPRFARQDLNFHEKRELCRVLATRGETTMRSIATEWNLDYKTLQYFNRAHAREIHAIAADVENKFAGQWMADKEKRIAAYMEEWELLNTSKYRNHHEWSKARQAALRAVAEELGQLPGRGGVVIMPVQHLYVGIDPAEVFADGEVE